MATLPGHCQPQNDPPVSPQPDPGDVNTSGPGRSCRGGAEDSDRTPLARPGIRSPPAAPAPRVNRWGRGPQDAGPGRPLGSRWGRAAGEKGRCSIRVGVAQQRGAGTGVARLRQATFQLWPAPSRGPSPPPPPR
ncbi:hypothetical protein mRhiFer1_010081 [Rhinolophus ferrumequinum]|uniref:Uncharacterized protein n=1 Tax=Rhinolophus ferrumequinum TaxID=59479 RepID=A0A7J7Y6K6_RHIFE|nr:hypothetical protein mRhiFer1_010081 [Rhinolophus ferrumequinum]